MAEINEFRVSQIVDSGQIVQLSLLENVQTEPISQKQMIKEAASQKLDPETQKQVMPLLDIILQAQPTIKFKSYQQTSITISMPKNRYEAMGRPQVGEILTINLTKI
jgi:phage-related protein